MKRIAFFAHYDPDGRVDDYVLHYISELLQSGIREVYFSTDCDLADGEAGNLPVGVEVVNTTRHGEYDFGSWKRCFESVTLSERSDVDELILCNDSCYGPLSGFDALYSEMQSRTCDFWGLTQVRRYEGYYPSYFLAFRRPVLAWVGFEEFFMEIGSFVNKKEFCLKYEVGLTHALRDQGFMGDCFFRERNHLSHSNAAALEADVFEAGMPFIRVMTARENPGGIAHLGSKIQSACELTGYPLDMIKKHLERISPSYRKFWNCQVGKSVKTYFWVVRVRIKPDHKVGKCGVKLRLFGIPLPWFSVPISYDLPER